MKRGGPLKRSTPLRQGDVRLNRTPLLADAEKIREFLRRGRTPLARSALGRGKAAERLVEGPLSPEEWRRCVYALAGGVCVVTGARTDRWDDPRFEAHHALPKRELRARGLHAWVWDARNGVWMTGDAHERHENASRRVPFSRLPMQVWSFCDGLDALDGTFWATDLVRRQHPERVR